MVCNICDRIIDVRVRRASVRDLDTVYNIEVLSFRNPYPKALLEFYLNLYGDLFLVAEVYGQVVGYIIGVIKWGVLGHILSIAVHPNFRRRGIGSTLLREEEYIMKCRGVKVIRLEVRVSNKPAIAMYRKFGYTIAFIKPHYYEDGEDAYVMFKILS